MSTTSLAFPFRATVLPGCKGTVRVQRFDSDYSDLPATVLWHLPQRSGRDTIIVQYDAVAEDGKTFSRNIAGVEERFRRNRRGRWISLDRTPDKYMGSPAHSNHFEPGPQRFEDIFPF